MKNFVFVLVLIILIACESEKENPSVVVPPATVAPVAAFTVNSNEDGVATFVNNSKDADSYEWDFGDGKGKSSEKNPSYQYTKSDKYTVSLKAIGKGGTNTFQTSAEIKIVQKDIASLDQNITAFLTKYNIVGASLAISKNGKLAYIKGFGYADAENNTKVSIDNTFRLASISKVYTGLAILKLIQDGKFKIDDKVFGPGGLLGNDFGNLPLNAALQKITVNHLLHHTSGAWGQATGGDVIDQNPGYNTKQFYDWVLNTRPTPKEPETSYDYSNINFNILGRIIEKVSGKSYIKFVKEDIVSKIGGNVELAGATLAQKATKEVKYYGLGSDKPFVYNIAFPRRDADGGLVSSSADLLKFCLAIDGQETFPEILNPSTYALFIKPSPVSAAFNYACGFGVWDAQNVMYSYGSLPGTRTGAMWGKNGMAVTLLLNTRVDPTTATNNTFIVEMQNLLLDVIKNTNYNWQNINQF